MELLQLKYFCDAAESENFSKTAKKYGVPASNISQSIHRLEKEFGITFFDRTANRIKLNHQGKIFYEDTRKALLLLEGVKEKIADREDISGELKILAEINRRIVTDAVEIFSKDNKNVSFYINHYEDKEISNYDFIITDKIFTNENYVRIKLATDEILLAIKKNNPLCNLKSIKPEDLKNQRFITMSNKSSLYNITYEICSMGGFNPDIAILTEDPGYIRKYVEQGLGVAFIPSFSWRGMFSENVILKKVANKTRDTFVYYEKNKYMTKAEELFLAALKKSSKMDF